MFNSRVLQIAAMVLLLSECRPTSIADGFEGSTLSAYWSTDKFVPGAIAIQSKTRRTGKSAIRITLRPGDQMPEERGSDLERAELKEVSRLWTPENVEATYAFSLLVPKEFPLTCPRVVLAQWKQHCPVESCTPDNPTIALRYDRGVLWISRQVADGKQVLFRAPDDIRGRWHDFRFRIVFSRTSGGRIDASLDGRPIVNFRGTTAYPRAGGYGDPAEFYFKMGIYRDHVPDVMTVYFDEYRKDLGPVGFPAPRP